MILLLIIAMSGVILVATAAGRIDWFHALIAIAALVLLWYVVAGGDPTLTRSP